jgi:hypothetical protein
LGIKDRNTGHKVTMKNTMDRSIKGSGKLLLLFGQFSDDG